MATASRRNSGAYNTLYTNVLEKWVNENNVEDLVFERTPLLAVFNAMAEKKPLPADLTVRLLESKEDDVDAFEYYDSVGTNPVKGAQAARFEVKQYSAPVTISWQESMELTSPQAISDHLEFVIEKQLGKVAERLAKDVYRGAAGNSKQITGLEELLPDYTHDQTDSNAATAVTQKIAERWQMRQANLQTYGGITRVAWADADTPGTYWEGMAVDMFGTGQDFIDSTVASGPPTDTYKRLLEAYSLSSWGATMPNLMVSSFDPYTRYESSGVSKQLLTTETMGTLDLSFANIKFKGATWFWDPFCKTYSPVGGAAAGDSNIYILNTRFLHFQVDSRADMVLGPEKMPTNQHAFVRHLIWRGQLICRNPRTQCRLFSV